MICTPDEGLTIGLCDGSSSERSASLYGPVALMMPCVDVSARLSEGARANLGADVELASGELVLEFGPDQFSVGVLVQLGDPAVVGDGCAELDGRHDQCDIHPSIIVLTWTRVNLVLEVMRRESVPS